MLLGRNRSGYDFRSMTASWARMIWLRFKSALRAAVSRLPGGHQLFRGIQGLYPTHLTTGIWGSTAEHPLLARVLDRTAEVLRTTTSAGQGRIRRPRARCSAAGARAYDDEARVVLSLGGLGESPDAVFHTFFRGRSSGRAPGHRRGVEWIAARVSGCQCRRDARARPGRPGRRECRPIRATRPTSCRSARP